MTASCRTVEELFQEKCERSLVYRASRQRAEKKAGGVSARDRVDDYIFCNQRVGVGAVGVRAVFDDPCFGVDVTFP